MNSLKITVLEKFFVGQFKNSSFKKNGFENFFFGYPCLFIFCEVPNYTFDMFVCLSVLYKDQVGQGHNP
jgi:hypothetical protein